MVYDKQHEDGSLAREIPSRSTTKLLVAVASSRIGVGELGEFCSMQITTHIMREGTPLPRMSRVIANIAL